MGDSFPLEMFLKVKRAGQIIPVVGVSYSDSRWVFADSFVVFQNGKKLSRDEVNFKRESSSVVIEWYNFVCQKEDIDSLRLLDENENATIRFYGSDHNRDKKIDKEYIGRIKKIIKLYDMLTKYYAI